MPGITATHWGNYFVDQAPDGTIAVSPVREDREPSAIGRSLSATHASNCRVAQPAIRLGYYKNRRSSDTTMRGKEPFVAVGWDEALDIAAEALAETRAESGNRAVYGGSYGWASAGRFHHAQSQIHRFLNGFGGYTDSVETYSLAAAEVLVPHILGMNAFQAVLESPSTREVVDNCRRIVFFGGAATRNMQNNPGGVGEHDAVSHFRALKAANIDVINISPIQDDVTADVQPRWMPCRPCSDVPIMLGLMHTLIDERLHDLEFLDKYCVGFGEFADYVLGKSDGQPKSADWASRMSEIPADEIRALARLMASERCLVGLSFSVQRAQHGEQTYWAAIVLAAMLGYIGLPGGGVLMGTGVGRSNTMQRRTLPFSVGALPQGSNPVTDFIPLARITEMLERPGGEIDYNGQKIKFPEIDLIYWVGGNPFHHHQDINRMKRAWSQPKTIITHEINWTTTARYADIVLPSTSPLERMDFAGGSFDNWLTPMVKVLNRYGAARDDYEIFSGLALRLGFHDEFTEGLTSSEWVRRLYDKTVENAAAAGVSLPDHDSFFAGAPIDLHPSLRETQHVLELFRADPVGSPLQTPSGKIEIFSEKIASFGYADCIGHPAWFEKEEWLGSGLAKRYPLHLLSNQPATRLHSQLDHGVTSQESKIKGREPMRVHPDDAKDRGIAEDDVVKVFNGRGAFLAGVRLSTSLRRGVVQIATGAWYDALDVNDPLSLEIHGNPNAVTADIGTSSLAQGPSSNSCLVEMERFEGTLPPLSVFSPPAILDPSEVEGSKRSAA